MKSWTIISAVALTLVGCATASKISKVQIGMSREGTVNT